MLCLLLLASVAPAQAPQPSRPYPINHFFGSAAAADADPREFHVMAAAPGEDYFDGTSDMNRVRRHMRLARELGARYLRFGISWHAVEKAPGKYDWRFWDQLVDLAAESGIELIPYVAYTPEWAASSPDHFWSRPPRDPERFGEFMFQIASRYRGRIRSWEIWNEPDLPEYWRGSAGELAQLVITGAKHVRQADPRAVVILGGFSRGAGELFQALISQYHVERYVDVVALHGYPESWGEERIEEAYTERIDAMRDTVDGAGLELWLNEFGYADYRFTPAHASSWGTNVYYGYEHTPAYAAAALFKSHLMALASGGVRLSSWYRIDDFPRSETRFLGDGVNRHLGLVDPRGRRKPQFYAYRFFQWLFAKPTRLIDGQVKITASAAPNSAAAAGTIDPAPPQGVLHVLEKQDGNLVLVGWLRSSHWDEVRKHTGWERDPRRERYAVQLPCGPGTRMNFYGPEGNPVISPATFRNGALNDVVLTGDRVFIADITCQR